MIYEKLMHIQSELKAPKGQTNDHIGYNYRSCEDILEAVKPLLAKYGLVIQLSDQIQEFGGRVYVKATAKLIDAETSEVVENTAFAREEESKKGMDGSQITGASSSYARKYALNGLFAIDDTKDSDATNKDEDDRKITAEQIEELKKLGFTDERFKRMVEYSKVSKLENVSYSQAEDAIKKLRRAKAKEEVSNG